MLSNAEAEKGQRKRTDDCKKDIASWKNNFKEVFDSLEFLI